MIPIDMRGLIPWRNHHQYSKLVDTGVSFSSVMMCLLIKMSRGKLCCHDGILEWNRFIKTFSSHLEWLYSMFFHIKEGMNGCTCSVSAWSRVFSEAASIFQILSWA